MSSVSMPVSWKDRYCCIPGLAWPPAGQLRKHRLQLWKRRKNNLDSGMPVRYLGSNIFMIEREISVDIFPSQLSRKYKCPQLFLYRKAYNLSGHCPEIGKYTNLAENSVIFSRTLDSMTINNKALKSEESRKFLIGFYKTLNPIFLQCARYYILASCTWEVIDKSN